MSDTKKLTVSVSFCLDNEVIQDEELTLVEANLGDLLKQAVLVTEEAEQ